MKRDGRAGLFHLRRDCILEGSDPPDPIKPLLRETRVANLPDKVLLHSFDPHVLQTFNVWANLVPSQRVTRQAPVRR